MEMPGTVLNLTGQVAIVDIIPKFTGNYSSVFLGALNGSFVAVKAVKATGRNDAVTRKFFREIILWASVKHQNIHRFHGFANDQWWGPFGALISPWCVNGDATRYLAENGNSLIMAERVSLWRGVIEGVAYLHEHQPTIVHGDLKPGNILIDDLGNPRICDFGLARVFLEVESTGMTTTSEHTGTPRYLAPELVMSEDNVYPTTASDVYALGCLGLEFLYERRPYENRANNLRGQIISDIKRGVPPSTTPPQQYWSIPYMWPLITQLWSLEPLSRPAASSLSYMVRPTLRSIPLNIMQRVAEFLDIPTKRGSHIFHFEAWKERTQHIRTLCLVSRALRALATPLLYGDIVINHRDDSSSFTQLIYTLKNSTVSSPAFTGSPRGFATHTRYFTLITGHDLNPPLDEIRDALCMMISIQVARILKTPTTDDYILISDIRQQRITHLRTLIHDQGDISQILEQRWISHAMPFLQALWIRYCVVPQKQSSPLFVPNLQEIRMSNELCSTVTKWVIPNLKYLEMQIREHYKPLDLINLLRTKGKQLLTLSLDSFFVNVSRIPEMLLLCPNLLTFTVKFIEGFSLSSLSSHAKLEVIVTRAGWREGSIDNFFGQVERFISAWRLRFPNLRVTKFQEDTINVLFYTENKFYTITKDYGSDFVTYRRWEGTWVEGEPPSSFYED